VITRAAPGAARALLARGMSVPAVALLTALAAAPPAAPRAVAASHAVVDPPPAGAAYHAESEAYRALAAVSAGEPSIAEVQEAAAREAERGGPDVEGFPGRSRLSALLPRFTAEYRRDDRSYRVVGLQGNSEVDYARFTPGVEFVIRATWDLGTLVAATGEIAAANAASARAQRREAALKRVTALFFDRRRAMLALVLEPPATPLARAEAELAVDRLTAELEALTGGLLSRERRR
jgi:hypothetical protein